MKDEQPAGRRHVVAIEPGILEAASRSTGARKAVVVGIGDYGGSALPLANPTRDAESVGRVLEEEYGFHCTLLLDRDATFQAVERAVSQQLCDDEGEGVAGSQWLFYFAGHGLPPGGGRGGRLLLHDPAGAPGATLSVDWLRERCLESRFRKTLLILDNCYSAQALVRPEELPDDFRSDSAESRRVRQVICAGGPRQPVLDGGSPNHSVFTQCLVEALAGWAGVHAEGGEIRFVPLLQHLKEEVDRRLGALGVSEPERQKTIGGNLVGTSDPRGFVLRPTVSRLSARTIRLARSGDPEERLRALDLAFEEAGSHPDHRLMAVELALRSIPARRDPIRLRSGVEIARLTDPDTREREKAARLLGELAGWQKGMAGLPRRAERKAAAHLLHLALCDPSPGTRHRARAGLRRLGPPARPAVGRIARRLADRRHSPLRPRAWEVVACLPESRWDLPPGSRGRALGTVARLACQQAWRIVTATPTRRRLLATPGVLAVLLYGYLASSFYLSPVGGWVGVRAGHPGLTVLPGVGSPLLVTDYPVSQVEDRTLVNDERLRGFWLPLHHGALPWADQLLAHLEPAEAGLGYWRLGEPERAFDRLEEGVSEGDVQSVKIAAYLGLQSESALPRAVKLLVAALEGEEELADAAREGVDALVTVSPEAIGEPLDSLMERLETASGSEAVALLEAIQRLEPAVRSGSAERLQALIGQLASAEPGSDHEERSIAAVAAVLKQRPELLYSTAEALTEALSDGSPEAREQVLAAVAQGLGSSSEGEEPGLPTSLRDTLLSWIAEEEDNRRTLRLVGAAAPLIRPYPELASDVAGALSPQLTVDSPEVRLQTAEAILDLDPPSRSRLRAVSTMSDLLQSAASSGTRSRVIHRLRELRSPSELALAVDGLLALTADLNTNLRSLALEALVELELRSGVVGPRLEPVLVAAFDDPSLWMKREGAEGVLLLRDRFEGTEHGGLLAEATARVVENLASLDPTSHMDAKDFARRLALAPQAARRGFFEDLEEHPRGQWFWAGIAVGSFVKETVLAEPSLLPEGVRFAARMLGNEEDSRYDGIALLWSLGALPQERLRPAFQTLIETASTAPGPESAGAAEAAAYLAVRHDVLAEEAWAVLTPLASGTGGGDGRAALRGLAYLAQNRPGPSRLLVPLLINRLSSENPAVRRECTDALAKLEAVPEHRDLVLGRLAAALTDSEAPVRLSAARALRRWGAGYEPATRWAAPLQVALRRETTPEAQVEMATALGVLAGKDEGLRAKALASLDDALASEEIDRRSDALEGLVLLGSTNPAAGRAVLARLEPRLQDPSVRFLAILGIKKAGQADPENGRIALDLLAERLFDPSWELAWDTMVNGIGPICQAHPELLSQGIEILERYWPMALQDPDPLRSHLASGVTDELLDLYGLATREHPERIWELLDSPDPWREDIAVELLARWVDQEPERIPEALERLKAREGSLWPQVRLAAARGREMVTIVQETHEALSDPERAEPWSQILEALPEVGVRPAILLALDRLEPGVQHR